MKQVIFALSLVFALSNAQAQDNGRDVYFVIQCKTADGPLKLWSEILAKRTDSSRGKVVYENTLQASVNQIGPYFEVKRFTGAEGTFIRGFKSNRRTLGFQINTLATQFTPGAVFKGTISLAPHNIYAPNVIGECTGKVMDAKSVKIRTETEITGSGE